MTAATSGYGTTFKIGDGGGTEVFTTIAEVVGISGPSLKLDTIDVTNMDSAGWREKIPTLKDAGEVQLDMNFLPANSTQNYSAGLLRDYNNRTLRNFKVVFSNTGATAWVLPGYVTSFDPGATVDGKLSARVGITLSGAPTLA